MGTKIVLFTRPDCELCEVAAALARQAGAEIKHRDISGNVELLTRYGTRIPVLRHPESGDELGFPFDADRVRAWLQERTG